RLGDMATPTNYDQVLGELPGVESFQWFGFGERGKEQKLRLNTKFGRFELEAHLFRSHLSSDMADHILAAQAQTDLAQLILAPAIGAGLAERFIGAGFSYLDARGNCHFDLEPFYIHIEGRTAPTQVAHSTDKGIRRAGYQVLF